jgi:shikimate kinase
MSTKNADCLHTSAALAGSIVLIGLMGAGKTTIGSALAKQIGKTFVDSDHLLEERTGVSVTTIFEVEGEAQFRDRESAILQEMTHAQNIVLSTGGGAVLREENRRVLRSIGTVIYLHAPPEVSFQRISRSRDRPLLKTSNPLARLKALYEHRHPLYTETAHLIIDANRSDFSQVVQTAINRLRALQHSSQ